MPRSTSKQPSEERERKKEKLFGIQQLTFLTCAVDDFFLGYGIKLIEMYSQFSVQPKIARVPIQR